MRPSRRATGWRSRTKYGTSGPGTGLKRRRLWPTRSWPAADAAPCGLQKEPRQSKPPETPGHSRPKNRCRPAKRPRSGPGWCTAPDNPPTPGYPPHPIFSAARQHAGRCPSMYRQGWRKTRRYAAAEARSLTDIPVLRDCSTSCARGAAKPPSSTSAVPPTLGVVTKI